MELEEKIMQVIYDSGYEPVPGNHKRGHVDVPELKEKLVTLFGVHYGDNAEVLARAKDDHVQERSEFLTSLKIARKNWLL